MVLSETALRGDTFSISHILLSNNSFSQIIHVSDCCRSLPNKQGPPASTLFFALKLSITTKYFAIKTAPMHCFKWNLNSFGGIPNAAPVVDKPQCCGHFPVFERMTLFAAFEVSGL
jgi:hypothetical protein